MVFKHYGDIRQHRVIQEEIDRLVLLLVCRETLPRTRLDDLRERLLQILGESMSIEIRCVESIAPAGRKDRLFSSRLKG